MPTYLELPRDKKTAMYFLTSNVSDATCSAAIVFLDVLEPQGMLVDISHV